MTSNRSAKVSRIAGHSASPSVPCRYINGAPLPPRARLSLQPLTSIVCRTNSMIHLQSHFAGREKVGEVDNRLKHFLVPLSGDPRLRPNFRRASGHLVLQIVANGLLALRLSGRSD